MFKDHDPSLEWFCCRASFSAVLSPQLKSKVETQLLNLSRAEELVGVSLLTWTVTFVWTFGNGSIVKLYLESAAAKESARAHFIF